MTRAALCVNNTNSVFRVHYQIIVLFLCDYGYTNSLCRFIAISQ